MLKLPKKICCKYCHQNVEPEIELDLIRCSSCGSGLAPIKDVENAGGWHEWKKLIIQEYNNENTDIKT